MVTLNDLSKGVLENKNAHEANRGDGVGCRRESGDFLSPFLRGQPILRSRTDLS